MSEAEKKLVVMLEDEAAIRKVVSMAVSAMLPEYELVCCPDGASFAEVMRKRGSEVRCALVDNGIVPEKAASEIGGDVIRRLRNGDLGAAGKTLPVAVFSGELPIIDDVNPPVYYVDKGSETATQDAIDFIKSPESAQPLDRQAARDFYAKLLANALTFNKGGGTLELYRSVTSVETGVASFDDAMSNIRKLYHEAFKNGGKPSVDALSELKTALDLPPPRWDKVASGIAYSELCRRIKDTVEIALKGARAYRAR